MFDNCLKTKILPDSRLYFDRKYNKKQEEKDMFNHSKMKKTIKQWLGKTMAIALSAAMLAGSLPTGIATVSAAEVTESTENETEAVKESAETKQDESTEAKSDDQKDEESVVETEKNTETESAQEESTEQKTEAVKETEKDSEVEETSEVDAKVDNYKDDEHPDLTDNGVGSSIEDAYTQESWTDADNNTQTRKTTWDFSKYIPAATATWDATANSGKGKYNVTGAINYKATDNNAIVGGLTVKADTVSYKTKSIKSDNTAFDSVQGLSLGENAAIAVPIDKDTDSVTVYFQLTSKNDARKVQLGEGSESDVLYVWHGKKVPDSGRTNDQHTDADGNLTFQSAANTDTTYPFSITGEKGSEGRYLLITSLNGETKFGKIVIEETKAATASETTAIDTSITSWDFSAEDFKTFDSKNTTEYNNLQISAGQYHSSGTLNIASGTVKVPVAAGKHMVIVGACYQNNFAFEDEEAVNYKSGTTNSVDKYIYLCDSTKADYVTINVKGTSCINSIEVREYTDDLFKTTSWDFADNTKYTGQAEYDNLFIGTKAAKYHSTNYGMQIRNGVILVPVSGKSTIEVTVGYTWDFSIGYDTTIEANTYKQETDGGKDVVKTYSYDSDKAGYVPIYVYGNVATYIKSIKVGEPKVEETTEVDTSVIDVWDFGAEALVAAEGAAYSYRNMLTEDIINSLSPNVAAGTLGATIAGFEQGDLIFADGGYSATHRWRTTNTNLTRYDNKSLKDADGNVYTGYIYSNKASDSTVYLALKNVKAGDIITYIVGSNSSNSDIVFENVDNAKISTTKTFEYNSGLVSAFTFYAPADGTYKIYSATEKLVVARIYRQHTKVLNVSGSVVLPSGLTSGNLVFTNQTTGAETTATIENGAYSVKLNAEYKYDVAIDKNGYVVDVDSDYTNVLDLSGKTEDVTFNVKVKAVDLVEVSGAITGLGDAISDLQLELVNDSAIYVPEITIDKTNATYTAKVEKGTKYDLKAIDVDDYDFDTTVATKEISFTEATTKELKFVAKTTYKVTVAPTGATATDLANAKFIFTRVNADGTYEVKSDNKTNWVYTFTGTDNIQLRNGAYTVKVINTGNFVPGIIPNAKIDGKAYELAIKFTEYATEWDFSDSDFQTTYSYYTANTDWQWNGLQLSKEVAPESGKIHAIAKSGSTIKVPVKGKATVKVGYYYLAKGTIGDADFNTTTQSTSTSKIEYTSYEYTSDEAGYVEIKTVDVPYVKNDENKTSTSSYLTSISVLYKTDYKETIKVGSGEGYDYATINEALDAVRSMDRTAEQKVTISIQPGNYEEMLVIDVDNVAFVNAAGNNASIELKDKGVNIADNAVRITSYYGHGYTYYSMGSDCKYDEELLAANKSNGYPSKVNPGSGTTDGSYWNATVVITGSNVSAEGIIFENSFNQYVSEKAANDIIVAQSSAKEGSVARASMNAGDTTVQGKSYVERAAALAIANNCTKVSFDNCKFIGRQDTLYGGTGVTAAFYNCSVYGGTDYICGPMTAVFAKCDLVFNTSDDKNDVGYITAAQTAANTRGYLMYNCTVTSTTPGVDTASTKTSKPGYFGRPWAAATGEAVFYKTIVEAADSSWADTYSNSLIMPAGWLSTLSGESKLSAEYGTMDYSGIDYTAERASWATVLTDETVKTGYAVTDFLGNWDAFAGKNMDVVEPTDIAKKAYVKFVMGDGIKTSVDTQYVVVGEKATKPEDPAYDGYNFLGWYEDAAYTKEFDFDSAITANTSVYAKWEKKAEETPDVTPDNPSDETVDTEKGLECYFADTLTDTFEATYTGSAITPEVVVKYNGVTLTNGVDYTIKYGKNTNAGSYDVVVKGKGTFAESKTLKVVIGQASLTDITYPQTVYVESGKNPSVPTVTYNGIALSNKDYTSNYADGVITLTGKGNFSGIVKINVEEKSKSEFKKFAIARGTKIDDQYYRNGSVELDSTLCSGIFVDKSSKEAIELVKGTDYVVTYKNNSKIGKATATFVGTGLYAGSKASVSFKIVASSDPEAIDISAPESVSYNPSGATLGNKLVVKYCGEKLVENKDYKVSYHGNKKITDAATYDIKFINNYKGITDIKSNTFAITAPSFEDKDVKIISLDKIAKKGKSDVYQSKPVVTYNGKTVPTSEYTVKYYLADDGSEVGKNNKVTFSGPEQTYVKIKVVVESKGRNYIGQGETYYNVWNDAAEKVVDISKAKVTASSMTYTCDIVTPTVTVTLKNGTVIKTECLDIDYYNNINVGKKAMVVVKGKADGEAIDGIIYIGSATGKFEITKPKLNQ
jgi:uncharacterized repeat protein (TIGR02543 family)